MKNSPAVILVVDDDRTILTIIEALLKKNGYEVITALNALMAKQVITENHKKIDAVLLDRMMPDMDGIDVVKWINNNKKISTLQIIMLTILGRPEQVKEAIDEGVFYYLTKPIQETVLKSVVASAVRESKQHKLLTQELKRHRNGFKLLIIILYPTEQHFILISILIVKISSIYFQIYLSKIMKSLSLQSVNN